MSSIASFSCPSCRQQFDWSASLAGRNLICGCGQAIQIPECPTSPPAEEIESYELKQDPPRQSDEERPPGKLSLDETGKEIPEAQVAPVLDYHRTTATEVAHRRDHIKSMLRDLWIPVGIIILGFVVMILIAVALHASRSIPAAVAAMGLRIGWDIAITILGGYTVYSLTDGGLAASKHPLLKLVALSIGRQLVWAVIGFPAGNFAADFIADMLSLPVFLLLFSYLFEECDFRDATLSLVLVSMMRWISYFGLWKLL